MWCWWCVCCCVVVVRVCGVVWCVVCACACVWCVVKLATLSLSSSLSFLFSFPFFFSLNFLFLSSFSLFFFLFSCSFSYSCSCSSSFSFSSFFFLPFYSLFSSLLFTPTNTVQSTDQQTRRPTLRHLNVMWRTAGALQSVLSPPPLHSLLPSLPLLLLLKKKKRGTFLLQEYSREEFIFYYSFKLNQKNRRRGKLQALQFYINSKTIGL